MVLYLFVSTVTLDYIVHVSHVCLFTIVIISASPILWLISWLVSFDHFQYRVVYWLGFEELGCVFSNFSSKGSP